MTEGTSDQIRRIDEIGAAAVWNEEGPGAVTLWLRGELDLTSRPQLDAVLARLATVPATDVTIDLREVGFFGVDGCRFVASAVSAVGAGGRVCVRNVRPFERHLLEMSGLIGFVEVVEVGVDGEADDRATRRGNGAVR